MKKEKLRYWFIVLTYNIINGSGTANVGQESPYLNQDEVCRMFLKKNKDALKGSIVITNFIEMTKEDYNKFFKT